MDSPDPQGAVSSVVRILRKATRLVQLAPFAYLVFYVVYLLTCSFMPEGLLCAADAVMLVSPATGGGMLVASRLFKLCRWHKAACLIPFASQLEGCIDSYVVTFTQSEIVIINTAIGLAALTFLALAFRHFFTHGKPSRP